MALNTWKMIATALAKYARKNLTNIQRGAILLPGLTERSVALVVFGNDGYAWNDPTRQEVEQVRGWLREAELEELAFGLSQDGCTWSLIARIDNRRFQTNAARAFHLEMVKSFLDEGLRGAWQKNGEFTDHAACKALFKELKESVKAPR